MRVLFIFLDGVGLGPDDPNLNPLARAVMPRLQGLLGGRKLLAGSTPYVGERASLLALDPQLGVHGLAQSATGQAVLLTGINIPAAIGEHYGPKPNPAIAAYIAEGNLFSKLRAAGKSAALLNAYPPRYFHAVETGKRLLSAIPLAVTAAGLTLLTKDDLYAGRALSADFTGAAWQEMLGFPDAPVLAPEEAGARLTKLSQQYDFSMFEYWATDYAGHKQDMTSAIAQLEAFDAVLGGLVDTWNNDGGLMFITSDHGNLEDLSTRRHTHAPVPLLVVGSAPSRRYFSAGLSDLTGVAPAIMKVLAPPP